ncbi:DNA repair protein RadC [Pectobacterium carotovorum subsp. carotovorum]|uniref:RadC family protein n=1 Tax=Pectobacterium carotovorum TaxID=554 RepID=UPI00057E1163|nr:DNA repair protein RadC [Pectobacterium carotovorum]KHT26736.1 DNA repair protein RadC [Pectobacterium carotovorum subsp. carotovorum]
MRELTPPSTTAYTEREARVINMALALLERRVRKREVMTSPEDIKAYLRLKLEHMEREVFVVMFLDRKERLIACESLFAGSIANVEVHPREIVRRAISLNAAAVICAHNHPSGNAEPSNADRQITEDLVNALDLIETRILDHIVVGHGEMVSFAERGWL